MVSRLADKNKFGGYTWHIKLDSLFNIFIHETNDSSFAVDFKEWKWISYKTHFSFISKSGMHQTIVESFDMVYQFFQGHDEYSWTMTQKENKLNEAINLLMNSKDTITQTHMNFKSSLENPVIKIMRGVGIDDNFVNLTTSRIIEEKYGPPSMIVNHNNHSMEMKYPNLGLSFSYKFNDTLQMIFLMKATGETIGETETGLLFDRSLTLDKVLNDYGNGEPRGSADSDKAHVWYSGIMFYALKSELMELEPDEININCIAVY